MSKSMNLGARMKTIAIYFSPAATDKTQRLTTEQGASFDVRVAEISTPKDYEGDDLDFAEEGTQDREWLINTLEID